MASQNDPGAEAGEYQYARRTGMTLKQSFAWWSFEEAGHHNPELLDVAAEIGLSGVDFLPPQLWPRARALGLELVVIDGHEPIEVGFNDPAQHGLLRDHVRRALDIAVREGVRNLAVMGGDYRGARDDEAIAACVAGLTPLAREAADAGIGLLLEPLNTKVDHPGHQCSSTAWGKKVIDGVCSPVLRLLYDAYHMQIMEGDLLRTIDANIGRIGHVHTAGVPGRHELDQRQEVNWAAIATRLGEHGYDGYVGHEFIPLGDPAAALRHAFTLFGGAGGE
jgi:hydroxypyruvate isomerase